MSGRHLTGYHVAGMFVLGFGIIIGVNLTLATAAVRTFPGTEVKNSYVASQSFEARRDAQDALGWTARATYADGALTVELSDEAGVVVPVDLDLAVGWPTRKAEIQEHVANGRAVPMDLTPGIWRIDVDTIAEDGTVYEAGLELRVRP